MENSLFRISENFAISIVKILSKDITQGYFISILARNYAFKALLNLQTLEA